MSTSSLPACSKPPGTDAAPSLLQLEQYSAIPKPGDVQKARVLSIGDDPVLTDSRQLVLQCPGHDIVSVASSAAFSKALLQQFNVVVLCHTIQRRNEIIHFIRLISSDFLLLVLDEIGCEPGRLGEVHVSSKPDTPLTATDNLLPKQPIAT